VSFESLLIHSVTIKNPTESGVDNRYGDDIPGATVDTVESVRIEPVLRMDFFKEELRNRDTRINRYRMFAKADSVVDSLSTVVWGGRSFSVIAEPALMPDSVGHHHYEALLEEILG
jgi:hypothetical protein